MVESSLSVASILRYDAKAVVVMFLYISKVDATPCRYAASEREALAVMLFCGVARTWEVVLPIPNPAFMTSPRPNLALYCPKASVLILPSFLART